MRKMRNKTIISEIDGYHKNGLYALLIFQEFELTNFVLR